MIERETLDNLRWAVAKAAPDVRPSAEAALALAEGANEQARADAAKIADLERRLSESDARVNAALSQYAPVARRAVDAESALERRVAVEERAQVRKSAAAETGRAVKALEGAVGTMKTATAKAVDMVIALVKLTKCADHGKSVLRCAREHHIFRVADPDGGEAICETRSEAVGLVKSLVEDAWARLESTALRNPDGSPYRRRSGELLIDRDGVVWPGGAEKKADVGGTLDDSEPDDEDAQDGPRRRRQPQPGENPPQRRPDYAVDADGTRHVSRGAGSGRLDGVRLSTARQLRKHEARIL